MFEIKVEGLDNVLKKFETYSNQLDSFERKLPDELVDWQRVDMRRQYPNVEIESAPPSVKAMTRVWPRSRLEQQPGFKRQRRLIRTGPKPYRLKGMGRQQQSFRPILRIELIRKLFDRMLTMVEEVMRWP
jgi:hypothetical protein